MQKVSVIVPIYNVESYLGACFDSIQNQTYNNLEIILINDGSSDNCGKLCDNYAKEDHRVVVVHKENGGVSSARNAGLRLATGDYIMFVDSDDFIHKDIVSELVTILEDNDVDIALCGHAGLDDGESVSRELITTKYETKVLSDKEALHRLVYRRLATSPWAKLYKRETFGDIRYQSGKINQDFGTTYKVFARANRLAVNSKPLYYYVKRMGSITNVPFSLKKMAGLEFAYEQLEFMKKNYPGLVRVLRTGCL